MKWLAAALVACSFAASAGMPNDDFLTPTAGRFDDPFLADYYGPLKQQLHKGLPFRIQQPRFEVYVLPSFQSEWFMTFNDKAAGDCIPGVVSWVEPSFWGAMDSKAKIQTKRSVGCIPRQLFEEVACAVGSMLAKTRYPDLDPDHLVVGMDGTTYYFRGFVQGLGVVEGSTWSPTEGTATDSLVRVALGLSEMLEKPHEREKHETDVKGALAILGIHLKRLGAHQPVHNCGKR